MKDEERVFRLTRRDGVIYWSGPYDHADQFGYERPLQDEEVRHLSIADAFDAAPKAAHSEDTRHTPLDFWLSRVEAEEEESMIEKKFNTVISFNFSVDHDGEEPTLAEIITKFTSRVGLHPLSNNRCEELLFDDFEIGDDRVAREEG